MKLAIYILFSCCRIIFMIMYNVPVYVLHTYCSQPHCRYCDLVTVECHNECGHCCQRKDLSSHLTSCPNKPNKCPHCSIYFTCNRIAEHEPHCSKMVVPESILSNIYKVFLYYWLTWFYPDPILRTMYIYNIVMTYWRD